MVVFLVVASASAASLAGCGRGAADDAAARGSGPSSSQVAPEPSAEGDVAEEPGQLDLADPCTLLDQGEAADVAGVPMPGEHEQAFDSSALYQGWAAMAGLDTEFQVVTAACTRASVAIDPGEAQEPPAGTVVLTSAVATFEEGEVSEIILIDNSDEDLTHALGVPAGLVVQGTGRERSVTITMIADQTHAVSVFGGITGAEVAESRRVVFAAAEEIAEKIG